MHTEYTHYQEYTHTHTHMYQCKAVPSTECFLSSACLASAEVVSLSMERKKKVIVSLQSYRITYCFHSFPLNLILWKVLTITQCQVLYLYRHNLFTKKNKALKKIHTHLVLFLWSWGGAGCGLGGRSSFFGGGWFGCFHSAA